jgi:hypothetical protein
MTHALWGIFSMFDEHKSQKAQQSQANLLATDSNQRDNTHRLRL